MKTIPRNHDSASAAASLATSKFGSGQPQLRPQVRQQGHLGVGVGVLNFVSYAIISEQSNMKSLSGFQCQLLKQR